tara:strand:+ start:130 stop:480 length:351 start_codon:yes stop_codon:yes gene_type:complete
MAKKKIKYSDLSVKELELLKDTYIDLKVKKMSNNDLKDFVIENISLQIKNTIGDDEELEAWHEMEEFFKDEFENIIKDIKVKIGLINDDYTNLTIEAPKDNIEEDGKNKKYDMWED